MNQIEQLQEWIKQSNYTMAFTGAGLSTESGIPDFRSSSGLYSADYEGLKPEAILTSRMLRTKPALVLKFYKERIMRMVEKEPNRGHLALKKLEDMGKLKFIITQNIDNLHIKAGSTNVLELHGNGTRFRCNIQCGKTYTYEQFCKMLETQEVPQCECGFSYIRPETVLFDEALPDRIFDKAFYASKWCNLMIAMGSSLLVQPAASLLEQIPFKHGAKLVIINNEKTPYDHRADLIIRESCSKVMDEVVKGLCSDCIRCGKQLPSGSTAIYCSQECVHNDAAEYGA